MLLSTMELQLVPPPAFVLLRHREGGEGDCRGRCWRSLSVFSARELLPGEGAADVSA